MDVRSYDPTIARWTSIDPVTHWSNSTYNAFDNNPIFWADPSGADAESFESFALTLFQNSESGTTYYNEGEGSWIQTDPKEVVKKAKEQFERGQKLGGKFKKAYKSLDALYSLGNGVSHDEQIKALKNVYNSLADFLPKSVSFKAFALRYDSYLALISYQMEIVVKGLREKSHTLNKIALQDPSGSGYFYAIGAFPGGRHTSIYATNKKSS